jgi:glycine betaine/proline transport system ATP-binding protein
LKEAFEEIEAVNINQSMQDILEVITKYNIPVPVVDDEMKFKGVISKTSFLKSLQKNVDETENSNV